MHDDQHGTAVVTLAATLSACRYAGVDIKDAVVGQIGLGAAGLAICRMLMAYGVDEVYGTDPQESAVMRLRQYGGNVLSSVEDVMAHCDIVIATTGVKGLIDPSFVREGQIILALSNPFPEISPEDAIAAGAQRAFVDSCSASCPSCLMRIVHRRLAGGSSQLRGGPMRDEAERE